MGFLDNVKGALKDALSTQASKNEAAARRDAAVVNRSQAAIADDAATPATPTTPAPPVEPVEPTVPADAGGGGPRFETYTVRTGDTLVEIGLRFGVTHEEIATANNIDNPDLIFPGQVFRIPKN